MEFIFRNKKKILLCGSVVFLILLGVGIYLAIENSMKNVTVNIAVAPLIAKVRIGDSVFSSSETVKIKPGFYEVEVYAEGFITKTGELTAIENETISVSLYLEPTEENSNWYNEHVWDGTARADIISNEQMQNYFDLQKEYLVLNYVPYNTFNYSIDYENDCVENDGAVCLIINAKYGLRDYAIQYLQSTGDDLSLYYVKGYDIPFKNIALNVPQGLSFDGESEIATMNSGEMDEVSNLVNAYIADTFNLNGYSATIDRVKNYDNHYYAIILAVYSGDDNVMHDTYRMIVGRLNGEWVILTNADIILARSQNPLIPNDVLKLANDF